ncbi:MAG: hypothetical protein INR71_01940 [Terriglobus roseus]|nr:hypothetical protein [Terriglobus roseus]
MNVDDRPSRFLKKTSCLSFILPVLKKPTSRLPLSFCGAPRVPLALMLLGVPPGGHTMSRW